MGSEYFINSQELEDKVRKLLPSQGGAGAGFDLSASTQIIPIIDVTESAEGSNLRQDLQTSLSHSSVTTFSVTNATTTLINNTGYYRVFGVSNVVMGGVARTTSFILNDGATDKVIWTSSSVVTSSNNTLTNENFDFVVFLSAGDTFSATSSSTSTIITGCTRQIADIDGNLVDP
tara:strand:+ start:43 stop:567 length:525 start_codon:yes stop_codon:yes gene_type:complete